MGIFNMFRPTVVKELVDDATLLVLNGLWRRNSTVESYNPFSHGMLVDDFTARLVTLLEHMDDRIASLEGEIDEIRNKA